MLSAESSTRALTPSGRISYARIDKKVDGVSYEKFEIPNLIELQLDSFAWFIEKGLRELFDEIRGGSLGLLRDLYVMANFCDINWTMIGQAAQRIADK